MCDTVCAPPSNPLSRHICTHQTPGAARGVVRELFGRFGHLTLPPSAHKVRAGAVEGGKVCICTLDYFADAPLKIGTQKVSLIAEFTM